MDLAYLNEQGIFPGPNESDEAFELRAKSLLEKSETLCPQRIHELYSCSPTWVEVIFQAKGLRPWEGAATWIRELAGIRSCHIQLKKSLLSKLYTQEEILAHEMVHAMRLNFDEERFEEILAYRTSSYSFRRYFGPLFSKTSHLWMFLGFLCIPWFVFFLEIVWDMDLQSRYFLGLPILGLLVGVLRLSKSQRIFNAALVNLKRAQKQGSSLSLALRLSDAEIMYFAKCTPDAIYAYAEREKEKGLRWQQLFICYF